MKPKALLSGMKSEKKVSPERSLRPPVRLEAVHLMHTLAKGPRKNNLVKNRNSGWHGWHALRYSEGRVTHLLTFRCHCPVSPACYLIFSRGRQIAQCERAGGSGA
jgi:hypothetical protein